MKHTLTYQLQWYLLINIIIINYVVYNNKYKYV